MTYKDDPKKEKKGAPATIVLKEKLLREWVSAEQPFSKFYKGASGDTLKFVDSACSYHNYHDVETTDRVLIAKYIASTCPDRDPFNFPTVVDHLVGNCKNKEVALRTKEQLLALTLPKTSMLRVIFAPTESVGNYDRVLHVITLDPDKNPTPDALLDTLAFESQNAVQRSKMTSAANISQEGPRMKAVAAAEFITDKRYAESLIKSWDAANIDDLVRNKLELDEKYLVECSYKNIRATTGKIVMPSRDEMPEQNRRQALWFWLTRAWSEKEQLEIWAATEHAEGMKATNETY